MAINVRTPPPVEPVTLEAAKLHCRIDVDADDTLINALIQTAREYCEGFQHRAYVAQTVEYTLDRWPPRPVIYLPRPPVQEILSVSYLDADGVSQSFTGYIADTDSEPARVVLEYGASWPTEQLYPVNPIRIEFIAGHEPEPAADPADPPDYRANIPESVKAAIKLCVGNWYENREGVLPAGNVGKELPMGVQALLWMARFFWTEDFNR